VQYKQTLQRASLLTPDEVRDVFANVDAIYQMHLRLIIKMNQRTLGSAFIELVRFHDGHLMLYPLP